MPHRRKERARAKKHSKGKGKEKERGSLETGVVSRKAKLPEFEQGHAIPPGEHLKDLSAPDVQHEAVPFHSCHSHEEGDVGPDCCLLDSASIVETAFYSFCGYSPREKESGVSQGNTAPARPSASLSPYHSSRIKLLKESRRKFDGTDLKFDIQASKSTWTEGTLHEDHELVREANRLAFYSEPFFHGNFVFYELKIDEGNLVGEGGEAEIYAAEGTRWRVDRWIRCPSCKIHRDPIAWFTREGCKVCEYLFDFLADNDYRSSNRDFITKKVKVLQIQLVVKVFKDGFLLSDLLKKWSPRWMTEERSNTGGGFLNLCWAFSAQVLKQGKFRGRFALLLPRFECDLRKLIDRRKVRTRADGPPFERDHALFIVHELAKAMAALHELGLLHRDLKAANVLCNCKDGLVDELSVADFESSINVIGTLFWRAPEIFRAMKTREWSPHPVTRESDVYSFAMTCYEVVTGLIPLEDHPKNMYDEVIEGKRPELPDNFCPELNSLIRRCWQDDPLQRPSFEEIVALVEDMRRSPSN